MLPQWIIEKKRDGQTLTPEEIRFFINGFTRGEIPDYQMAAMAMAILFRGMTPEETAVLTDVMMRSGDLVDLSAIDKPKVDKHSTGGIGDKVSLVLAPLAACCDLAVPMISGRGLGITGGTLDKLDSIPGYRSNLDEKEFIAVVKKCGCAIVGQTGQLAPADKKLYALRDVTGTVPSIALITASIMSKKLAEGMDALVLDVKWGKGAFMKTLELAWELAQSMVHVGVHMRKGMAALITDMNQPLGRAAGNAVEIAETVATLRGRGPADLVELTLLLAARMLVLGGKARTKEHGFEMARKVLDSGAAFEKFKEMVRLQGGDPNALDHPEQLPTAAIQHPLPAPRSGHIAQVDAELVGKACAVMGAGRARVEDRVDLAAGVTDLVKIGEQVEQGQPLAILHANNQTRLAEAIQTITPAFVIQDTPVAPPPIVTDSFIPGV